MNQLLVDAAWLAAHLDEVVVADVRWSPTGGTAEAEGAYAAGHIPAAVFLDVDRDLAGSPFVDGPGRHPLPTPEAFARTLSVSGIGDDDDVVVYDDVQGSLAARLWWMLDATERRAAVLDGGLQAWRWPIETGPARRRPSVEAAVRPWPTDRVVEASDVTSALADGAPVIDARAAERYRGDVEPIDPVAGHIPGARSAPWAGNLDAEGRFLAPEVLRDRYASLGVRNDGTTIGYCGSGVTTCHDLLAMRLAGLGDGRLYAGSWSGWVSDRSRPVAVGED
ncbi:MAG: sulfurtransferase [Actinomycetota bacterium]|nr:sulfurtransferase [Actinomycetota bacterium]